MLQSCDNIGNTARTAVFTTANKEWASLADPGNSGHGSLGIYAHGQTFGVYADTGSDGTGVVGFGGGSGAGVVGFGGISNGAGVTGDGDGGGDGVRGLASTGTGLRGTATNSQGAGVLAENTADGNALQVVGKAAFSRSGLLTVAAGSSKATQTGVALTSASLVLVTLQRHATGLYVLAAVPNVSGSSFTVYLSNTVSASTKVAWFVIN